MTGQKDSSKTAPSEAGASGDISYSLRIERRNVKNINIYLRPPYEEVLVTAPRRLSQGRINAFLQEKEDWICRNLRRLREEKQENRLAGPMSREERKAYEERLRDLLPPLMEKWEALMGVKSRGFCLRKMKRAYGVCHIRRKEITFNLWLGAVPEALVEYIVVHELCHLREPSHNRHFHSLVSHYLPDWKGRKRALDAFFSEQAGAGQTDRTETDMA